MKYAEDTRKLYPTDARKGELQSEAPDAAHLRESADAARAAFGVAPDAEALFEAAKRREAEAAQREAAARSPLAALAELPEGAALEDEARRREWDALLEAPEPEPPRPFAPMVFHPDLRVRTGKLKDGAVVASGVLVPFAEAAASAEYLSLNSFNDVPVLVFEVERAAYLAAVGRGRAPAPSLEMIGPGGDALVFYFLRSPVHRNPGRSLEKPQRLLEVAIQGLALEFKADGARAAEALRLFPNPWPPPKRRRRWDVGWSEPLRVFDLCDLLLYGRKGRKVRRAEGQCVKNSSEDQAMLGRLGGIARGVSLRARNAARDARIRERLRCGEAVKSVARGEGISPKHVRRIRGGA